MHSSAYEMKFSALFLLPHVKEHWKLRRMWLLFPYIFLVQELSRLKYIKIKKHLRARLQSNVTSYGCEIGQSNILKTGRLI